jgi:hypothetical protein
MTKKATIEKKPAENSPNGGKAPLSLYPLTIEDALRAAMQAGPHPTGPSETTESQKRKRPNRK